MVTSAIAIAHKIARTTSLRRGTQVAILSTDVYHPSPCIPLSRNRTLILAVESHLSASPSVSLSLSLSLLLVGSLLIFRGREAERTRNRFGLAVLPDSSIGGRSVFEADRPTRADPGSAREAGRPGRLHQDGKQPRAPFESPPGGEGNCLSRGSSVPAGGNGPTHRFAQPRRTPLARSRLKKRRRDTAQTNATAIFLLVSLPRRISPSPPVSSFLPLPSLHRFGTRTGYGVRVRASSRPRSRPGIRGDRTATRVIPR